MKNGPVQNLYPVLVMIITTLVFELSSALEPVTQLRGQFINSYSEVSLDSSDCYQNSSRKSRSSALLKTYEV